jgi:hypothetical protein
MQAVKHVQRKGKMHTEFWWGNLRERDHFEDLSTAGSIILKWLFKTWEGEHGPDLCSQGKGQV